MPSLKRYKTDISDLVDESSTARNAAAAAAPSAGSATAPLTRPKRVFSLTRLTMLGSRNRVRKQRTRARTSVDKSAISWPLKDAKNPVIPPSPTVSLGLPSPPAGVFASTHSSPGPSRPLSTLSTLSLDTTSTATHSYSTSDPVFDVWASSPQRSGPPPSLPTAWSSTTQASSSGKDTPNSTRSSSPLIAPARRLERREGSQDSTLELIPESPFEIEGSIRQHSDLLSRMASEASMEPSRLQPPMPAATKGRAIQQAKEMEMLVAERAKRSGDDPPPYDFFELIGKGAYGRVFKGKNRNTNGLVAIKIIDIDKVDYEEMTTKNLSETLKEINILQQLRDSRARPYVNIIEEARPVHNELWIVSEYASGGSVNTLMKPTMVGHEPGLPERFIIPIARELALGLKYIHEAGVLHRDLKCNNILILEDGRVQLCDFGVSGQLEPEIAKRSTIVGTPYWMAPELQKEWIKDADPHSRVKPNEILYGSEVDVWAYGCTVYEMAFGYPPFHKTVQWDLPTAGVPVLEGDRFSQEIKDFVAFVLQPDPHNRPTPDDILEHPFLANTSKMYPTVTLVKLVEQYYMWEQQGGARVSLFNPYGAQAPDPLAPEMGDDDDDDWTFSTTEEFEQEHAGQLADPFMGAGEFGGMKAPPADIGRFEQLQAQIKEEQITRGQKRLNRLFDKDSTPYRYSVLDVETGRPPSDLVLRDFNPGAPNRETVIDLDFAAPTVSDVPSIDLGEVPTVKANRMNRLLREMQMEEDDEEEDEEEQRDSFDEEDELTKRATRDWKFPTMNSNAPAPNRQTMEWKFPTMPDKTNRRTMEWTFDAAKAESSLEPMPKTQRISRRRDTQEWTFPMATAPLEDNRKTRDFVFPMRDPSENQGGSLSDQGPGFPPSPTLGSSFRPSLRHSTTEPLGTFEDYPRIISAPSSPLRTSMIDLDMANVNDFRPSTSDSASTYTVGTEQMNDNPFNLEDQVHLSQTNNRASYHMKSQSEPNQAIPGLLTPQQYDEQGHPTNQDPHNPSMHTRGASSVSQMQAQIKPPPGTMPSTTSATTTTTAGHGPLHHYRAQQRSQQLGWDGWNHNSAYGLGSDDYSPPASVTTDTSLEDEDVDDLWDTFERLTLQQGPMPGPRRPYPLASGANLGARRTASRSDSDADDNTDYTNGYPPPQQQQGHQPYHYHHPSRPTATAITTSAKHRTSRLSVAPNGHPLLDFPIPRGPDPAALCSGPGMGIASGTDALALQHGLWKGALEMRDGVRACRQLLRGMRMQEVVEEGGSVREGRGGGAGGVDEEEVGVEEEGMEMGMGIGMDTVRVGR